MAGDCAHENCFADTACALGHHERQTCPHWVDDPPKRGGEKKTDRAPSDVPWNGYALGSGDLARIPHNRLRGHS